MSACVTGAGAVVLQVGDACDPSAFLKARKSRKFMGLQDDLAVVATGRALASAGWPAGASLGERAGLFLAVGYIPFREEDILAVLEASTRDGAFDVRAFGEGGFQRAHPLLTFRCLPNMPAYHVSVCFDVQGPYCVTYPGPAQLYGALEEACAALADGRVDVAIVAAVAAQTNFLVRHHFARIDPPVAADRLRDAGATIVLETEAHARARGATIRARLEGLRVEYTPFDVLREGRRSVETIDGTARADELGPALLGIALADALAEARTDSRADARAAPPAPTPRTLRHALASRDGVRAESLWVIG